MAKMLVFMAFAKSFYMQAKGDTAFCFALWRHLALANL